MRSRGELREPRGGRRDEAQAGAGPGMVEAEHVRVECRPAEGIGAAAVRGVAGDRMPEPGEVHADLVPPPGLELHLEQGVALAGTEHAPARDGSAPPPGSAGLAYAAGRIVDEPALDRARGPRRPALDDREVRPLDGVRRELPLQGPLRAGR